MLMLIGLSAKNAILYLDFVVERIGKMPFPGADRVRAAALPPDHHDHHDGARDQLPAHPGKGGRLRVRARNGNRHAGRNPLLRRPHLLRRARRLLPLRAKAGACSRTVGPGAAFGGTQREDGRRTSMRPECLTAARQTRRQKRMGKSLEALEVPMHFGAKAPSTQSSCGTRRMAPPSSIRECRGRMRQ